MKSQSKTAIAAIIGAGLLGLIKSKSSGSFIITKGYEPKTPTSLENFCKRKSKASEITSLKLNGFFGSKRRGFRIPDNISNMVNLRAIEIRSLDHSSVSIPDLSQLENLERITIYNPWDQKSLEKSLIDQILINISKAPNLKTIAIHNAGIEILPDEFCLNLKNINEISLKSNKLSSLPETFAQIGRDQEHTMRVVLDHNNFTEIPQMLYSMSINFRYLGFNGMMQEEFPSLDVVGYYGGNSFYSGFEINNGRIKFSHFGNPNDNDPAPLRLSQVNYRFDLLAGFYIEKVVLGNLIIDRLLIEKLSILKPFTDLKCLGCKIDSYSELRYLPNSIKKLDIISLYDASINKPYNSNLFSYITHLRDLEDIEFSCNDGDYIHEDILSFPKLSRIRTHMIGHRSKLSYPDLPTLSKWYLQGKIHPDVFRVLQYKVINLTKSQIRKF